MSTIPSPEEPVPVDARDARVAFLRRLIDDAGLFPPARLPMEEAVAAHGRAQAGTYAWVQGRFLCPASRLDELAGRTAGGSGAITAVGVILDGVAGDGSSGWSIGVREDCGAAEAFARSRPAGATVDVVEARLPTDEAEAVPALARELVAAVDSREVGPAVTPYLEIPISSAWYEGLPAAVAAVAGVREQASQSEGRCWPPGVKIRCGGLDAAAFPSPEQVARFVCACARENVPFKATAGLHHPVRHTDEATGWVMHGFLNVVGAAVLATAAAGEPDEDTVTALLAEEDPDAIRLDAEGFSWRDFHAAPDVISSARARALVAYGSCSFDEPIEELEQLGVLPIASGGSA